MAAHGGHDEGLAASGIDTDTIAAAMNTTEFRLRENNTGSYPRGLIYMLRSLAGWLYGRDPFQPLAFEAPLQQLKDRMANSPTYFEGLIRRYLLDKSFPIRIGCGVGTAYRFWLG